MKKTIYLRYSSVNNMGDKLNKEMLEDIFDVEIKFNTPFYCDMIGIGSGLSNTLFPEKKSLLIKAIIRKILKRGKFYVWGTGFMNYSKKLDNHFLYSDVEICSLRGKLTQERVEKILGHKIDVPLGDGGLLAERWIGKVEKKYEVGIIPHYKEACAPIIKELKGFYPNSVIIDLKDKDTKKIIRQIASCNYILSSSLHGLIVADSYHIPNRHVMFYKFGEKMLGDGFKFADYYSSYNMDDSPIYISKKTDFPTIDYIANNYKINGKEVEEKKNAIYDVFPFL